MGFSVYLKGDETPVKIEANQVDPENNVLLFRKDRHEPAVAVIPLDNVWYVVKDQEWGTTTMP